MRPAVSGKEKTTGPFIDLLYTPEKPPSRWTPPGELDLCNLCLMTQVALEIIHAILLAYPRASRQGRYHTV